MFDTDILADGVMGTAPSKMMFLGMSYNVPPRHSIGGKVKVDGRCGTVVHRSCNSECWIFDVALDNDERTTLYYLHEDE